uniref:TEA domain-containing protein n=1 Tax=Syphacia muris TaxID=451379 RepID=A0A0N5AER4_9BILA
MYNVHMKKLINLKSRNELIARYIKIRCGKTRTRKQVSSHIQVLARKRLRESQAKAKSAEASPSPGSVEKDKLLYSSPSTLISLPKQNTPPSIYSQVWPNNFIASNTTASPFSTNEDLKMYQVNFWQSNKVLFCRLAECDSMTALNGIKATPSSSLVDDRAIASSQLALCGFTAYVEPIPNLPSSRVDLVKIPKLADEPLETVKLESFARKYPSTLADLYKKGPRDCFFIVKCWANVQFGLPNDRSALYAVDSFYESNRKFDISVSTKVCSFGNQVIEKIEVYSPIEINGKYHFQLEGSPMCEYMVEFVAELKKLNDYGLMNSVLDNFTILQIVTNKDTEETLMVIGFVFEVSPEPEATCRLYRLVAD